MNSYTSLFDPVPPRDRAGLVWLASLASAGTILLGCMATVAAVDPYDSRLVSWRYDIKRDDEFRRNNIAQWAAFDIARDSAAIKAKAEVLVLGDSRGEQLRGGFTSERPFQINEHPAYDLSFGGASVYEMMKYFQINKQDFPNAKSVIIVMALTKLLPRATEPDRAETAVAAAGNPLRYLLDYATLAKSAQWLVSGRNASPKEPKSKEKVTFLSSQIRHLDNVKKHGATVIESEIAPFISELKSAGLRPVFLIPPVHPLLREKIAKDLPGVDEKLTGRLRELAEVYQVPQPFEQGLSWIDAVHVCQDAAVQLLPMLMTNMQR